MPNLHSLYVIQFISARQMLYAWKRGTLDDEFVNETFKREKLALYNEVARQYDFDELDNDLVRKYDCIAAYINQHAAQGTLTRNGLEKKMKGLHLN